MTQARVWLITLALLGMGVAGAEESKLDGLLKKLQTDVASCTEEDAVRALELARDEGRPVSAALAVKNYLNRPSSRPSEHLLLLAAENAYLVGDYRTAVARYKGYLKEAQPSEKASDAAAMLYMISIDFLEAQDDAYAWMREHGGRFRQSDAAKRFDRWFVTEARSRRDYAAMAERLVAVMDGSLPLEQEQVYFWNLSDWLMNEVREATDKQFLALADVKRLANQIRDPRRKLRYELIADHLAFQAGAAGREGAMLDRQYRQVVSSAKRYFDQDTTFGRLKDIMAVFNRGDTWNDDRWKHQKEPKQSFIEYAFVKLSDEDKERLMNWRDDRQNVADYVMRREQWAEMGSRFDRLFSRSHATARVPFVIRTKDRGLYKKQARFLKDVPSIDAAAIRALAETDDLAEAGLHLVRNSSWHLSYGSYHHIFRKILWPAIREMKGEDNLPRDYYEKALVKLGLELLDTPVMLHDRYFARDFLRAAFDHADEGRKKDEFKKILTRMRWLPYDKRERKDVFNSAYDSFRRFADWARRESRRGKVDKSVLDQISPLAELFRELRDKDHDIEKAPNALCRQSAVLDLARRSSDEEKYLEAGKALYEQIKGFERTRPAFCYAVWDAISAGKGRHRHGVDTFGLQAYLMEQIGQDLDEANRRRLAHLVDQVQDHRWRLWEFRSAEQGKRLNQIFVSAATRLADQGDFWPALAHWVRATRDGRGWSDTGTARDLVRRWVKDKTFLKHDFRFHDHLSVTVNYQITVAEFDLDKEFPPASYFDDLFVEEAKRTKVLDWEYWRRGEDPHDKVTNCAAEILTGYEYTPRGFQDGCPRMNWDDLDRWYGRALRARGNLRNQLIDKTASRYGKTRYDRYAMGALWFRRAPSLEQAGNRDTFFKKLDTFAERALKAPERVAPPHFDALDSVPKASDLSSDHVDVLVNLFPHVTPRRWHGEWNPGELIELLPNALLAKDRRADMFRVAPHLWKIASDRRWEDGQRQLAGHARQALANGHNDLAAVLAETGLSVAPGGLEDAVRSALTPVRSRALEAYAGAIPVPPSDPRYALFKAQAQWQVGNLDSAWQQYMKHRDRLVDQMRELDPKFILWLIDRHTINRDFVTAETLAQHMEMMVSESPNTFDPEIAAGVMLAQANIAFYQSDWPLAKARYARIVAREDFEGTRAQINAELKIAEALRLQKQYDEAEKLLEEISKRRDRYAQAQAFYQIALVRYDQEDFEGVKEQLGKVFDVNPVHNEARLLEARYLLKTKQPHKVVEGVPVGEAGDRKFIIPGEELRVHLDDRNLSHVAAAEDVEITVRTSGGDEETIRLRRDSDSRTKFRGSIVTAMEPMAQQDGQLQVLGDDEVTYGYSKAFMQRHNIPEDQAPPLTVITNASLAASSSRILSEEELQQRAEEERIRRQLRMQQQEVEAPAALADVRAGNQIKPGNPINMRVVDLDRNITAGPDVVEVTIRSSSGDTVRGLKLEETDTHSGVFEGAARTQSAQATAFASDAVEGKNPNFAISAKTTPEEYWVGLPVPERGKTFSVDLNDNVPYQELIIDADVPGNKLKRFLVQTSLNGTQFTTIGRYPEDLKPWDGAPRLHLVKKAGGMKLEELEDFKAYMSTGYFQADAPRKVISVGDLNVQINRDLNGHRRSLDVDGRGWYVAHLQAAFAIDQTQTRTFKLDHKDRTNKITYAWAIDGVGPDTRRRRNDDEEADPYTITRQFRSRVHYLDVYVLAEARAEPHFQIMTDAADEAFLVPCPKDLVDPVAQPILRSAERIAPATVSSENEGGRWRVKFAPGTSGRILKLIIADYEMDAPAIQKLHLTDVNGQQILPTQSDFRELRRNNLLEIVPGDKITIQYRDPKVVERGREMHEAFLTATFTNADVSACFMSTEVRGGTRTNSYTEMRRFKPDDVIHVFVRDPDMDMTDEADEVRFSVRTTRGESKEFKGIETAPHTGVFQGRVHPVTHQPQSETQIQVPPGDEVIITYVDEENVDPGIPWERTVPVEQAYFVPPQMRVFDVTSVPIPEEEMAQEEDEDEGINALAVEEKGVEATHRLVATRPVDEQGEKVAPLVLGGPLLVEVLWPTIALSSRSTCEIYVQTSSGREKYDSQGQMMQQPFDINVPGTIKLTSTPSAAGTTTPPPGYDAVTVLTDRYAGSPLDDGRFTFSVPMELGTVPEQSLVDSMTVEDPKLAVNGQDHVFIAFKFELPDGTQKWYTREARFTSDAFMEVMDRRYQEEVTGLYVGEKAYLRIVDFAQDKTGEKDTINVTVTADSGQVREIPLMETYPHTGEFRGLVRFTYLGEEGQLGEDPTVVPVIYGDNVVISYGPEETALQRTLQIYRGSDGQVMSFTKQFEDPDVAVQTQFRLAEARFELAKKHRKMGEQLRKNKEEEAADRLLLMAHREMGLARKLLEEALRDFPDVEGVQAQARYLLGNLALERGNLAENPRAKANEYAAALRTFSEIVVNHSQTEWAPKALYKKALTLEKQNDFDDAAEEYVKLSYRYPENELVAETIARLGNYFLQRGKRQKRVAAKETDPIEREKLMIDTRQTFKTAGDVFGRLAVRFPQHPLADKTTVLAAQCYMRGEHYDLAVKAFDGVLSNRDADPDLRAEAYYWAGHSYMEVAVKGDTTAYKDAYRMFKRLTWDYPATKWAKFARARLTEPELQKVEESGGE